MLPHPGANYFIKTESREKEVAIQQFVELVLTHILSIFPLKSDDFLLFCLLHFCNSLPIKLLDISELSELLKNICPHSTD